MSWKYILYLVYLSVKYLGIYNISELNSNVYATAAKQRSFFV